MGSEKGNQVTKKLYFCGLPGEGYGWGVCSKYLIQELGKLCTFRHGICKGRMDGTLFMPIADHDLNPAHCGVSAPRTLGLCFFEYPLGPKALENSKLYDLIFCGSTWCKERLAERGIHNTEVLIQGVDHEIFKPMASKRPHHFEDEFWIFSGGKFEYRKGQDIVLAAFKLLAPKYPKMRLVTLWQNLWPQLCHSMAESKHIKFEWRGATWNDQIDHLCRVNGLSSLNTCHGGMGTQAQVAELMNATDLGVFPNRCEGGTNLVLMEYLACGKPAIATTGHGHDDIYTGHNFIDLPASVTDVHWDEAKPDALAEAIEDAYNDRFPWSVYGEIGHASMQQYTWRRAAEQIVSHL